jgi:hypothetical protein
VIWLFVYVTGDIMPFAKSYMAEISQLKALCYEKGFKIKLQRKLNFKPFMERLLNQPYLPESLLPHHREEN